MGGRPTNTLFLSECRSRPPSFDVRVRRRLDSVVLRHLQPSRRIPPMRYMFIVSGPENLAASGPPPAALIEEIGRLAEEALKDGKMVSFGGLKPTSSGARMRITKGK